eukprot:2600476-Rhodomonas_salina.1
MAVCRGSATGTTSLSVMVLRARYKWSGTEFGYAPTRLARLPSEVATQVSRPEFDCENSTAGSIYGSRNLRAGPP